MSVGYVKGVHTGMVTVVVMMILHTVHKDTSGQVHNVLVVVLAVELTSIGMVLLADVRKDII